MRYEVEIATTYYDVVEVEADSPEEAERLARRTDRFQNPEVSEAVIHEVRPKWSPAAQAALDSAEAEAVLGPGHDSYGSYDG